VHVTERSSGRTAVVEFDLNAEGAGQDAMHFDLPCAVASEIKRPNRQMRAIMQDRKANVKDLAWDSDHRFHNGEVGEP
jgi:hypothetical protein